MPRPRIYAHPQTEVGIYHVISRCSDRTFRFESDAVKDQFVIFMKRAAAFHQVEVLTYCLMSNHFHILVRVPGRPEGFDVGVEELMVLLKGMTSAESYALVEKKVETFRVAENERGLEAWRLRMIGRMFSLSGFMKSLKQRFTQWFNRKFQRQGTMWEGRFKSLIVAEEQRALRVMAAYIDLNPVRAGIVDDPAKYRWCGYAEAMRGEAPAQEGLRKIVDGEGERFRMRDEAAERLAKAKAQEVAQSEFPESPMGASAGPTVKSQSQSPLASEERDGLKERSSGLEGAWKEKTIPSVPLPESSKSEMQPVSVPSVRSAAESQARRAASPKQRRLRALATYRQLLGAGGAERLDEKGNVIRRGLKDELRAKLGSGLGLKRDMLLSRVRHFTDGVVFGSKEYVNEWFEKRRTVVEGQSQEGRKEGARPMGKAPEWGPLRTMRQLS